MRALIGLILLICPQLLVGQGNAPLRAVREATIGCDVCGSAEEFGTIESIALGPRGILVIDAGDPYLRFFDFSGKLVKAVGRRGTGPGEYMLPMAAAWYADDQVDVVDARTMRLTRLSAAREQVSTRKLPAFPMAFASAGTQLIIASTDFKTDGFAVQRWRMSDAQPIPLAQLDTTFPRGHAGGPAVVFPLAVKSDGSFAVADAGSQYRIRLYDVNGKVRKDIARDIPRPAKTPEEIKDEEAEFARNRARMVRMRQAEGATGPGQPPRPYPLRNHIRAIAYDDAGRLWVMTGRGTANETVFDVYSGADALIAEVVAPAKSRRFAVGSGRIVTSTETDDGVPAVAVWRIPALPR